jgi:type I restriction enzyme, S subunit
MSRWPGVPLGEVLRKSEEWLAIHPEQRYKEVTVRLWGNGVVQRREVSGAEIASDSRLLVHAGQFIISRIDARNGASGLIPRELEGAIVSNDFPVFSPDPAKLHPLYLGWLSKTKDFVELCKAASEGTTNRVRLKEDHFLAMQIPLPPLAEQRRLVERIEAVAAKVAEAKRLGGEAAEGETRLLMAMAHRDDLSREEKQQAGWLEKTLADVLRLSPAPQSVDTSLSYPNLGIYSFGRGLFKKSPIEGLATSATTLFRVKSGQFIYSRLFAFEGAYGVVTKEYDGHYVSNEYPTFDCDPAKCVPAFLRAYFKAPQVWGEIAAGSKGLGDRRQRVHPEQILANKFWLPPLDWQRRIVGVEAQLGRTELERGKTAAELDALLPAGLDRAFRGEL